MMFFKKEKGNKNTGNLMSKDRRIKIEVWIKRIYYYKDKTQK